MKDTNTTPLLGKQKSCLGAINSRPRNLKTALNDTFDFIEIVNSNWLSQLYNEQSGFEISIRTQLGFFLVNYAKKTTMFYMGL